MTTTKMKPMLAGTLKKLEDVQYPAYVTPKLDGIRCLTMDGKGVSRSLKPIRNKFIQSKLATLPDYLDGELVLRDKNATFQQVSSAVMSTQGKPDFMYLVFDYWKRPSDRYKERIEAISVIWKRLPEWVEVLIPIRIRNEEQLLVKEQKYLEQGYEGIMLRTPDGPYKFGRSGVKEGFLLKLKRFTDSEAVIYGFEERMHNANVATKDALGHTTRSQHKENLEPTGMLGALQVCDDGVQFKIGTGFDDALRKKIWKNRKKYHGLTIKYKYQAIGVKEAPRFPVFLGFRDKEDM